jgi:hypothetical protein
MSESKDNHSTRVAIISACVSFALSIVFAAYIVGQRTGKVLDLEKWRTEISPKIERMDSVGTLSFEHWKASHDRESDQWKAAHAKAHDLARERIESRFKDLDARMREVEKRIDGKPNE